MPLAKAFAMRPERFRLLEKGIVNAGWKGRSLALLEIGCAGGDAAAHLVRDNDYHITAIDISRELIEEAQQEHSCSVQKGRLNFLCANAEELPFAAGSFAGIYSEAAFSPLTNKEKVIAEYGRLLKPGGRVLINDFAILRNPDKFLREEVIHIPCFAGVETMESYCAMFEKAGFKTILCREEYGELIRIAAWLCKVYKVSVREIGAYLSSYLNMNRPNCAVCRNDGRARGMFFDRAKVTYCQMIFEKRDTDS